MNKSLASHLCQECHDTNAGKKKKNFCHNISPAAATVLSVRMLNTVSYAHTLCFKIFLPIQTDNDEPRNRRMCDCVNILLLQDFGVLSVKMSFFLNSHCNMCRGGIDEIRVSIEIKKKTTCVR